MLTSPMANLPPSLALKPHFAGPNPSTPANVSPTAAAQGSKERKMASAEQLVLELSNPELRENALHDLSKKRELFQDLAPLLWNSFVTIAVLLQEIISIYPVLFPPTLSPTASNRVCNALALLRCRRDTFFAAELVTVEMPNARNVAKALPNAGNIAKGLELILVHNSKYGHVATVP